MSRSLTVPGEIGSVVGGRFVFVLGWCRTLSMVVNLLKGFIYFNFHYNFDPFCYFRRLL